MREVESKRNVPAPNRFEKFVAGFASGFALKNYKGRCALAMAESYTGASKKRRSMVNWQTNDGDFNSDTLPELPDLRERSETLYHNNMIAAGAINTKVTSIVGRGLTAQSRIDNDILGLSEKDADAWETKADREYNLWSESKHCSVNKKHNFRELQALSFLSALVRGDSFVVTPEQAATKRMPYKLRLQLIEADRVCNKDNVPNTENLNGGIETHPNGALKAAHILNGFPGSGYKDSSKWQVVPFFGEKTERRNVLHLFSSIRADQSRGVPDLAPVIEGLKQFGELTQATIDAAVIQTFLSVFIEGAVDIDGGSTDTPKADSIKLESAAIIDLAEGEIPHVVNPTHPNANYNAFAQEFYAQIGTALGVPKELLVKHFQSSYSAAQAALLEAWRFFMVRRSWLIDNLCQPVRELWLEEAVSSGRLNAPGFFNDPIIRAAYSGADWVGPPRGHIRDDVQNKADGYAEDRGWKTGAQNTQERGGIWDRNHRQRVKEVNKRKDDGLITTAEVETTEDIIDENN